MRPVHLNPNQLTGLMAESSRRANKIATTTASTSKPSGRKPDKLRVQSHEATEDPRVAMEELPEGYMVSNTRGQILEANQAAAGMLNVPPVFLIGKPLLVFVFGEDRASFWQGLRLMNQQDRHTLRLRLSPRQRKMVFSHITLGAVRGWNGNLEAVRWLLRDIGEETRNEALIANHRAQLSSLAAELSVVQERERRRIAEGIHDRVSQPLAMAKLALSGLKSRPLDVDAVVAEIALLLQQSIDECRTLTFELSPPVLYELGFVPAVEWLGDQLKRRHQLQVHVDADEGARRAADANRVVLFQVVRELLANVVKHSGATAAAVNVRRVDESEVRMTVVDNGIGFKSGRSADGFGLFNVRTRVEQMGGAFEVRSFPGKGTRILVSLPPRSDAATTGFNGAQHADTNSAGG